MPEWKVLITDNLEEAGLAILCQSAQVTVRSGISAEELPGIISGFHALVVRSRTRVTSTLLENARLLKVVGRAGVGVDNIDLQAARQHGIVVVNTPKATTQAVGELTIGLLFALARHIPFLDSALKQGQWLKNEASGLELNGKILGVIGMGNIGIAVARSAKSLDMQVLGYDPYLSAAEISLRGAQPASLPELYARSDFITLHIPLTPQTEGMIDRQALQSMKPGVRLVCTSRGGIMDEAALLEALDSGQVAEAALDVFLKEPPGLTDLVRHPHLVATPHIGAQTREAQARAAELVATEVLAALNGEALHWRIA
jgi:D-3-phosphoglycerate dehydrogenase